MWHKIFLKTKQWNFLKFCNFPRYDCVEGIRNKVDVVETLCSALQTFGEAITTITSDILALDVGKILGKISDISRMLRL